MKTYTPAEYRQMADNWAFGKFWDIDNPDQYAYGWLNDFISSTNESGPQFSCMPFKEYPDNVTWFDGGFAPCAEPVELEFSTKGERE